VAVSGVPVAEAGLADRNLVPGSRAAAVSGVPVVEAGLADRNLVPGSRAAAVSGVPVGGGGGGEDGGGGGAVGVALAALALTWLNPHVYLDTVVLLGSVAAGHGDARWWFAAGAGAGSVLWFAGLGYGAALLRPVFARPAAWRVLDATIALVMTAIAATLVLDLVTT